LKVFWLKRALNDLNKQLDHIAEDNPLAALDQGDHIDRQVNTYLPEHPLMGRSGRRQGTRELVLNKTSFIAVYRIRGDRIEILRLLHSSQKWP
jgi:toxin ParE1/3/4